MPYFFILALLNEGTLLSEDILKTIRAPATAEMKVKGSRFIGRATPAPSREDAESLVAQVSRLYHDATHNCFAYRIGYGDNEYARFNDDGEPSGTAGRPILQAIIGRDLTNVVVVVTRYFGGIKLGTGGLIRAYAGIAADTLSNAHIVTFYPTNTIKINCTYQHVNTIMNLITKFSGKIVYSAYAESISLRVLLPARQSRQFRQCVIDETSGQVMPEKE